MSKWIENIRTSYYETRAYDYVWLEKMSKKLDAIDKLLRKAMLSTDDENLSDRIRKELDDV